MKAELDAKIQELKDSITAEKQQVADALAQLQMAIDTLNNRVAELQVETDLTAEIQAVQDAKDAVEGIITP